MARTERSTNDSSPGAPRPKAALIVLLGGLLVVGLIAGLVIENIYRGRPVTVATSAGKPGQVAPAPERMYPTPGPATKAPGTEAPAAKEIPPWESTPENTPSVPPGHIPAWQVKPPRPEPGPPPPTPVPPPDPATHRPPMHNPGGVNGDRPPRPVPGLE